MTKPLKLDTRCWSCGEQHRVSNLTNQGPTPEDGDVSFCIECGQFAIFDHEFPDGVRKPTPNENFQLKTDSEMIRLKWAWIVTKRGHKQ
jgi:hypothetical protein